MLAYMNKESLKRTLETKKTHFWSRSRKKLWLKGETSGHFQQIKSISYDCDADTLLVKVEQTGVACHTGERSCFFRDILEDKETGAEILSEVYRIIQDRKGNPKEGSYVSSLFKEGKDKILKKIIEESCEVILDSKNDNKDSLIKEVADLWFHTLVMLGYHDIPPQKVYQELKNRRKR
jgi:phosphoribosyl-ATP pyrophosphohydrolase/phosphoribosyl-AMP cyclohydrolase